MRELVCNRQFWARAVVRQLRSYKVGQREHFPATVRWKPWKWRFLFNIFCQRHNPSALRITVRSLEWRYLGLLVYYSMRTSRHWQNGSSYVPKKILIWMLREAMGVLKATVDNRIQPITFIHIVFCSFLFLSARAMCSLPGYAPK